MHRDRDPVLRVPTMRFAVGLRVLAFPVIVGCAGKGEGSGGELLPPDEASARVTDLLYGQNLIANPQVNTKMNEYVLAVSRDGVPVDSVMPNFHRWLTTWVQAHPDQALAARLEVHRWHPSARASSAPGRGTNGTR